MIDAKEKLRFKYYCYSCDAEIKLDLIDAHTMNDIRDGQYIEYEAVTCPECGMTNEL